MSKKISLKMLREIVASAGTITYHNIVETLDEAQASYNEHSLKGVIADATEKGWLVEDGENYSIRKRSGGGSAPTALFQVAKATDPAKAKMVEKPYSKELEETGEWSRTPLAASRRAKTEYYNTVTVPAMDFYREMIASYAAPVEESEAA